VPRAFKTGSKPSLSSVASVEAPACCARPATACQNVAHLPRRNAIQYSPRFKGRENAPELHKTKEFRLPAVNFCLQELRPTPF